MNLLDPLQFIRRCTHLVLLGGLCSSLGGPAPASAQSAGTPAYDGEYVGEYGHWTVKLTVRGGVATAVLTCDVRDAIFHPIESGPAPVGPSGEFRTVAHNQRTNPRTLVGKLPGSLVVDDAGGMCGGAKFALARR